MKIRDEFQMTLDAYQSLYDGGIVLNAKNTLISEKSTKLDAQKQLTELEAQKHETQNELSTAVLKYEKAKRRLTEERIFIRKTYDDEINFLRKNNQQIKDTIEIITAPLSNR